VNGTDPRGAGFVSGVARADGYPVSPRMGSARTPADLREQAVRLIEIGDPDASLRAAFLYVEAADRTFVEAAQLFHEARLAADQAAVNRELLDADRKRLAHDLQDVTRTVQSANLRQVLMDTLDRTLMERREALDIREASLRARESELMRQREALGLEILAREAARREQSVDVPLPAAPGSSPLVYRPNPLLARTPCEFAQCLREFRDYAGHRSLRAIADQSGGQISFSTVRNVLESNDLHPRLDVVKAIVRGSGGSEADVDDFADAWRGLFMRPPDSITLTDIPPIARGV
jgi:hypothetical protein